MDIGKSFSYQFQDKQWTSKLGSGALISLVPILNFALSGYIVNLTRNVMQNSAEPLPNWDNLGKKFTDGIILLAAGLIYALPGLVVLCLPLSLIAFSGLLSGNRNLQDIGQSIAAAGGVLLYCLLCLFILYIILLSVIHPAILVVLAREGTFSSCFQIREIFGLIGRNAGPFFTAWIIYVAAGWGVGLVVGFLNLLVGWIPCLGWIVGLIVGLGSTVYLVTVYAHLFGQFGAGIFGQNQGSLSS